MFVSFVLFCGHTLLNVKYSILYIASFVFGGAGAWFISRWGSHLGLLDNPNARSSHDTDVPKGGAIGILAAFVFCSIGFSIPKTVWIPATLLTDRMTFVFYFYPVVGSVCIGLALGLGQLRDYAHSLNGKRWWPIAVIYGYLGLHAAVFVLLSPVFARWLPSLRSIFM